MKTVIIGGVAGGMSAATRLRRLDESHEIVVLERSPHVSYANCGLPYVLGGVIEDRDDVLLQTPETLRARFAIDVRTRSEVVAIDPAAHSVRVHELDTDRTYDEPYDRLVLSPGATAFIPDVPGIERAHTLRTVTDLDRLLARVDTCPGSCTAVIVGGGFIGIEAAENLRRRGLSVTIVELAPHVLAPLDSELVSLVQDELRANDVTLALGTQLGKVLPDAVELADGTTLPADLVVLAIGVRPETWLATDAGLAIGPRGGISVDDVHRTSDPHIYAVGDAVEKRDALSGEPTLVPLANIANRQGRVVADHIMGRPVAPVPAVGTAIVRVFSLTVAVTGWNERRLRAAGRPHLAIHTHPQSNATYYPGAQQMALKLLVDPASGAILGAQAVGRQGVDTRIDVIATAIRGGLTAPDLTTVELAYAPPYGSAKDAINMAGYVAANRLDGSERSIQWHELPAAVEGGARVLDVRTPGEFAAGHIPGSVNIPVDDLRARHGELTVDPAAEIVVTCAVGQRAHTAAALLASLGYPVTVLDGGYRTWHAGQSVPAPR